MGAVNLYICYTLDRWSRDLVIDFVLGYCFFGSENLTKDADPDKDKYSSYGIGFNSRSQFSFIDGSMGKNVIIFGADMNSFVHVDNNEKDILILGEGPTLGSDVTTLTGEAKYPITFTPSNRRLLLSLHYNGSDNFLFVDATKIYQFQAKDSEIKKYTSNVGNVSKDFTIDVMKKTGLKGKVNFFLIIDLLILMKFQISIIM